MKLRKKPRCYISGPIERDPGNSLHSQIFIGKALEEFGIEIIGDSFKHLAEIGRPQDNYGPEMRKIRNLGRFRDYVLQELLLDFSFKEVLKADFTIIRPAPDASGGTTSELTLAWLNDIPRLVIIGPHCENMIDNDSTFIIRMLADKSGLLFRTEAEVAGFIYKNLEAFKKGRNAIRRLIARIKRDTPEINDCPKSCYEEKFEGRLAVLQGRPGCGKDTQARMLQDFAGFKFFGSGFALRRLYNRFPHLAKKLGEGHLAPSELIISLMMEKLTELEGFEPVVFSGAPKLKVEARSFMNMAEFFGRKPVVIVPDISEELSRERIIHRRNCSNCEKSFDNRKAGSGSCPLCGSQLEIRGENADPISIKRIYEWYNKEVEATLAYFESLGLVRHIDGNRNEAKIFMDILGILRE